MGSVFSKRFFIITLLVCILYVIFSVYLMNASLVLDTIFGTYSFYYKFMLLFALLKGMLSSMTVFGILTVVLAGLLTGANISLVISKTNSLGEIRNTHVVVGGSSLLSIVGSGCASCGLPVISLIGLGSSLAYLPFHGQEISYISLFLLFLSFILLLKNNSKEKACSLEKNFSPRIVFAFSNLRSK